MYNIEIRIFKQYLSHLKIVIVFSYNLFSITDSVNIIRNTIIID